MFHMKNRTALKQASYGKKGGESYYIEDILVLKQLRDYYKGKSSDSKQKN